MNSNAPAPKISPTKIARHWHAAQALSHWTVHNTSLLGGWYVVAVTSQEWRNQPGCEIEKAETPKV